MGCLPVWVLHKLLLPSKAQMRAALNSVKLLTCRPIFSHSFSLHRVPPPYFPTLSPLPTAAAAALFHHLPRPLSQPRVSAMSTNTGGSADDNRSEASSSDGESAENYTVEFALSPTCSLKILKGDITQWFVDGSSDAIVNAANERMLGGGGVDGAIHRAAGRRLREACYEVPEVYRGVRCPTGEARITTGFRLPASHVIHTVGPVYDEDENPEALLESAYRNTLTVAKEHKIDYVAFPAISCGVYGYPYDEAASVAISTIKEFSNDFKEVHFVLFLDDIYEAWLEKAKEILEEGTETDNVPRTADDVPMGTGDASKSTADVSVIADTSKSAGDIAMNTDDASMSTADVSSSTTDASQNTVDASKATNDVPHIADASDTHPSNAIDNASKIDADISKSA